MARKPLLAAAIAAVAAAPFLPTASSFSTDPRGKIITEKLNLGHLSLLPSSQRLRPRRRPIPFSSSGAPPRCLQSSSILGSGAPSDTDSYGDVPAPGSASDRVEVAKRELIEECDAIELGSGRSAGVEGKIRELERLGEDAGFGQASSLSGLVSGEW